MSLHNAPILEHLEYLEFLEYLDNKKRVSINSRHSLFITIWIIISVIGCGVGVILHQFCLWGWRILHQLFLHYFTIEHFWVNSVCDEGV